MTRYEKQVFKIGRKVKIIFSERNLLSINITDSIDKGTIGAIISKYPYKGMCPFGPKYDGNNIWGVKLTTSSGCLRTYYFPESLLEIAE